MGFANPKGRYHVGPKKKTRSRKFHKPICDEVKQTSGLNPMDEATVKVLSQMDDTAMGEFVMATAHPNPKDVVIIKENGRVKPLVLDDNDERQTNRGRVYVGIGGVGIGVGLGSRPTERHDDDDRETVVVIPTRTARVAVPTPKVTAPPKMTETEGEIVGYIIKKPNGELVLKLK